MADLRYLTSENLDAWLPDPQICTRHRREAAAPADVLWTAAQGVNLDQTRTIGALVRWRIPGVPADQSFAGLLAEHPFAILAEGERWSISGLCGPIWTLARDYAPIGQPLDFHAYDAARSVRVLFAHWVQDDGDGRSTIFSEARVQPTDRVASARLRALWLLVGAFERLIGAEPLALAVARAQDAE